MSIAISISNSVRGSLVPGGGVTPFVNEYSMEFDGSSDYVDVGNPASLQITGALTLSAWVKIASSGGPSQQCIISKHSGSTQRSYSFWAYTTGSTTPIAYIYNGASVYNVQATTNIRDGFWHHVMLVYTPSTSLNIYIDGVLEGSNTTSIPSSINNAIQNFEIGRFGSGLYQVLGNIDEVAVWNSDQNTNAATIYNSGAPNDLSSLSPLSWWRMGDGDSFSNPGGVGDWTFFDNGSGGNDGTSSTLPESARLPITANSYSLSSFVFGGIDDFVSLGNDASRKVQTLTMSVWAKPTANASDPIFLNGHPSYGTQGIEIFWNFNNFRVRINGTNYGLGSGSGQNNWTHIVISYDGNTLKRMTNGVANSDVVVGATINYTNYSGLLIGRSVYGYALGLIDEVAFWDSDQSANFSTIYGNGVPTDILSLNPLNYYRMGESATWDGANWTFVDQGSGGNDGISSTLPEGAKTGDQPYVL